MTPPIAVRNLAKRYGAVVGVRDLSFPVQPGEIFGLLGPDGAGKTTTLERLAGLRGPDAGEIAIGGLNPRTHPDAVKEKLGTVLQGTALPDALTPREALRLFGSFFAERVAPRLLLERFALTEKADARFDTLSGGQRQRLALALAFVNRPQVILLDEPTTGLDPQARRELQTDILRLKQEGHTVLLSTHDLAEAERLCDRVAIIDHGEIVTEGSPRELLARADPRHDVTFVSSPRPTRAGSRRCRGRGIAHHRRRGAVSLPRGHHGGRRRHDPSRGGELGADLAGNPPAFAGGLVHRVHPETTGGEGGLRAMSGLWQHLGISLRLHFRNRLALLYGYVFP
jgi:ABC-2 type transport system ATP-binding protein